MLRGATVLACLLCLTCSASAQTLNSTAFANLTVIRQNDANFSSNLALPSFPCGASSPGLVGGYKSLDLDDVDLYYVTKYVLDYFTTATSNLTDCDVYGGGIFNITDACSQVGPHCRPHCRNCLCCCCIQAVCCCWQFSYSRFLRNLNCDCRLFAAPIMPLRLSLYTAASVTVTMSQTQCLIATCQP